MSTENSPLSKKDFDKAFNWSMSNLGTPLAESYLSACECLNLVQEGSQGRSKLAQSLKPCKELAIANKEALCRVTLSQIG